MATGKQHANAQVLVANWLAKHYTFVTVEKRLPTPNPRYIYDGEEFKIKPYDLDVYAVARFPDCNCEYDEIGIEIDGKVGHKTTKHQTIRDIQRSESLKEYYPKLHIERYDTKQLVGRGYINPKTKRRTKPLTEDRVLADLGIKCTHIY